MRIAVEYSLEDARERGKASPELRLLNVSDSGARFEIELRFLAGETYCCAEPACFLGALDCEWWRGVRSRLLELTGRTPPVMWVLIQVVVNQGAVLEAVGAVGANAASRGYSSTYGPFMEGRSG